MRSDPDGRFYGIKAQVMALVAVGLIEGAHLTGSQAVIMAARIMLSVFWLVTLVDIVSYCESQRKRKTAHNSENPVGLDDSTNADDY
jgi:hypothetical protein